MRKFFNILMLMFPVLLFAQNSVSVLGISLGGDLQTFVQELKNKGFKIIDFNEPYYNATTVYLSGDFYGFKNCRIDVLQDNDLKVVTVVNIRFRKEYYSDNAIKSMIKFLDNDYGQNEFYQSSDSRASLKKWTWTVLNVPVELTIQKDEEDEFFGWLHVSDPCFVKKIQNRRDAEMRSHIKFMGHYVSEPSFVDKLKREFKIWKDDKGSYRGDVGGYESLIEFLPHDFSMHIAAIKITKPKYERWVDLKKTYHTYKNLFLKKYKLTSSNEHTGIRAGSSLSESEFALRNIMTGDGNYGCIFTIPGGSIIMNIVPKKGSEYPEYGEVIIYYVDEQYFNELEQKEEQDKLDDL